MQNFFKIVSKPATPIVCHSGEEVLSNGNFLGQWGGILNNMNTGIISFRLLYLWLSVISCHWITARIHLMAGDFSEAFRFGLPLKTALEFVDCFPSFVFF